ncbi:MAG TPA: GGDEF domain-containing protein [Clostridiaceae bacterium]|nr:GGDEF domain-containing protein [Clostridiaceae bacterium]
MIKKLEEFLFSRLSRRSFKNEYDKFLYLISYVACTYAVSMNFFLLLFHFAINLMPLFCISLSSFLINVLCFWLVEKGRYLPFGLLLSGTVIIYTLATAICIGTKNLVIVYLLVTLMMQIIIPYASKHVRALMIAALLASMIALVFIGHYMTPLWDIGNADGTLAMFNIHLSFFGTVIQLTIGNTIWDTILKFNEKELKKIQGEANTDPLTGLFNRRYADNFFNKLRTSQIEQDWCVAMLDIDNFKLINDTYGHQIGDVVLMLLSNLIKKSLRKTDYVFRWGGEEFLILMKDIDVSVAFNILDKLRTKLESENLAVGDNILKITVTIGVCSLDIHDMEQSIYECDHLMYKGKISGKNKVVM